jgi:hypothetical protein
LLVPNLASTIGLERCIKQKKQITIIFQVKISTRSYSKN